MNCIRNRQCLRLCTKMALDNGSAPYHSVPGWRRRVAIPTSSPGYQQRHGLHLQVSQDRLMDSLHHTCQWGPGKQWGDHPTEIGMSRLALSDSDKQARDWFVETTQALGCEITVDAIGNIFAVRPGRREGPATFAGSHLDTQPTGGRYDGILGIHAGIEMLRSLQDNSVETEFPVGVVNWTNEEGARFPVSMMGSGVWAQAVPLESAYKLRSVTGEKVDLKAELERIGYLGQTPASYESFPMAAHFELHIEQGPVLEAEERKVGVVQGVQAYSWFTVEVQGRDSHTGTTPLSNRSDALLLTSKLILHSHRVATEHSALVSTGIITASPGSTNTIPGLVEFSLDIRSPKTEVVKEVEAQLKRDFAAIAKGEDIGGLHAGCTRGRNDEFQVSWRTDSETDATVFHKDCIQCVRDAALDIFGTAGTAAKVRDLSSGAGHDSVYASRRCPTTMIFVPCRGGVSHNPEEYTSPEDCSIGAQMILNSVLQYDQLRKAAATGV